MQVSASLCIHLFASDFRLQFSLHSYPFHPLLVAREMRFVLCGARYVWHVIWCVMCSVWRPCCRKTSARPTCLLATRLQRRASEIVRCSSLMIKALRAIKVIITLMYSSSFEMFHRIKSQGFYRVCKESTCVHSWGIVISREACLSSICVT